MIALDAQQAALLSARETKPIYLVEIQIGEQEFLSTNGLRTVGSQVYTEGEVQIRALQVGRSAQISLVPSAARDAQFASQSWRFGRCAISLLPARYLTEYFEPDYVEDDYGEQGDVFASPLLLLEGTLLAGASRGGRIEYTVGDKVSGGRWVPGVRIAPPLCNHLPTPGTVINWEGRPYVLEGLA